MTLAVSVALVHLLASFMPEVPDFDAGYRFAPDSGHVVLTGELWLDECAKMTA